MRNEVLTLDSFQNWLNKENHTALLLLLITAFCVILLLMVLFLLNRQSRLQRRLQAMMAGTAGINLEEVLVEYLNKVEATYRKTEVVEQMVGVLQAQMPHCFQKAHLIRYDAFDDVGGQQSFSAVLLDAQRSGLIISGVYNRMDMRVYVKYLKEERASQPLSQEEEKALRECIAQ